MEFIEFLRHRLVWLRFASGLISLISVFFIVEALRSSDFPRYVLFMTLFFCGVYFYFAGENYKEDTDRAKRMKQAKKTQDQMKELGY